MRVPCRNILGQKTIHDIFFNKNIEEKEKLHWEDLFFKRTYLANKTFKTTARNRLENLNELSNDLIQDNFNKEINVMDVAVSSGITTLEWSHHLEKLPIKYNIVATDKYIDAYFIQLKKGNKLNVLIDKKGHLLEFNIGNQIFRNFFSICPISWLPYLYMNFKINSIRKVVMSMDYGAQAKSFEKNNWRFRKFPLLSSLALKQNKIKFIEDDIILDKKYEKEFDVIRAANIINHGYFSEDVIRTIIKNLKYRLKLNGLFIVNRTLPSGENNGSIFQLQNNGFALLERLGNGSEVESLVLNHE